MSRVVHLSIGFIFLCTSCVEMLPEQFSPNDVKQDQIFPIDQIIKTKCYIKTLEPLESRSVVSQAQKVVLESNQSDSVVFDSHSTSTFPVINNLPVVEYEVGGNSFCKTVLTQKEIRLVARPHTSYEIYFQVTGSHLRVLISGALHELPYQRLAQAVSIQNGRYALPIGGYPIQQGQIRNTMNVENQETHLLDFFPNEDSLESVQSHTGVPQQIRQGAKEIYIPDLSSGFSSFRYQEKPDILPKTYFEGVWYSGVSVVSTKKLSRNRQGGSGHVVSGDSYSNYTPGQKVSFQFESGRLKAINEYYRQQGDALDYPAEAEVLSIPVQHLDYRNTLTDLSVNKDLEESLSNHLSWEKKRYVSLNFAQVEDFHRKRVRAVAHRYGTEPLEDLGGGLDSGSSVTVREIRFAPDYFDFVIVDANATEYRFSFFKKYSAGESTYQPKTIANTDSRFEFFKLHYNTIFPNPLNSFRVDYEDRIRLMRVHPNEKGLVPVYFSTFTPQDDLIRSIGREAVSLWNQALSKAKVPWRLYLDETKDVNVGDNRYHILNITNERNRSYAGLAQFYADDETGELIATVSNVIIPDVQEFLEQLVIGYAYEKYDLLNPLRRISVKYPLSMGSSFVFSSQQKSSLSYSSYSMDHLHYLFLRDHINQFNRFSSDIPFTRPPRSLNEVRSYFTQVSEVQDVLKRPISQVFSISPQTLSPELRDWLRNFKTVYALKQGRFVENDGFEQIQNNVRAWNLEDRFVRGDHVSRLGRILNIVCHDIENPLLDRKAFQASVHRCSQKIYPVYALGVTGHEIGHALFSLRHNFAASADYDSRDDNKYQLKHLTSYLTYENKEGEKARVDKWFSNRFASSLMDYLSVSSGEQWAPGAYDIAAIHSLYDGASEEEESSDPVIDLFSPPPTIADIINDSLNKDRDQFGRCSDWDVGSSAYCLRHDTGSEPHEIALNEVKGLFYVMDQYFYSQDIVISNDLFYMSIARRLRNLMVIYHDWRRKLDQYSRSKFNTTIEHLPEGRRETLFFGFRSSLGRTPEEQELFSFYKARNLIYHTLTYLAFLPNRYCVLKKDWSSYTQKIWKPDKDVHVLLELSKVISAESAKSQVSGKQPVYPVLSCWKSADKNQPHPAVARYMSEHYPNYSLQREFGHFLYSHSLPQSAPYKEISGRPHKGAFEIRAMAFKALTLTGNFFPVPMENSTPALSMMNEIDIQKGVERLLLARMTRGVFYPVKDFFESFSEFDLETLSPEFSAYNLFRFPPISDDEISDPLFRDELIQPQQLTENYQKWPQSRTDQFQRRNFYQNFLEEERLMILFNILYKLAYEISGGPSNNSISERSTEINESVHFIREAITSKLLMDKAIQYNMYRSFPSLSTRYYLELDDFLVFPNSGRSIDNFGSHVLSELAKNSARLLWTKPYRESFEGKGVYTSNFEPGFGHHLYSYLGSLLSQFQVTRLGRFYFMYAYLLALGLLDGYERSISTVGLSSSSQLLHGQSMAINNILQESVLHLFGFVGCNGLQYLSSFYSNLDKTPVSERIQYYRDFEQELFKRCAKDPSKKGKLHRLFIHEGQLLNRIKSFGLNNFVLSSPYIELPSELKSLWRDRLDLSEERFQNRMLAREVDNLENYFIAHTHNRGGIDGIHTTMIMLFQSTFIPSSRDKYLVKQWIQSNRQMLIDVIPKLMLMYSEDRRFIGEFMFLSAIIYKHCNEQASSHICRLMIENFIGHYFRGSDYESSDPQLTYFIQAFLEGRVANKDDGIPFDLLAAIPPQRYKDRNVDVWSFNTEVISDYLFYERGWDTTSVSAEELRAQRDLLFTILPLGNLRFLSYSNYALSRGINDLYDLQSRPAPPSVSEEERIYPYDQHFSDETD